MSEREELQIGDFPIIPKQERAQAKRNALLESGHILFVSKGYEQTTAKDIAAHAGVAIGTFYRYFSDKRQLLMSLLEDKIDKYLPPEPSWTANDPEVYLAKVLEEHERSLNESGLYRVLPEILLKDKELAEMLSGAKRQIHSRVCSNLQKAYNAGLTWKDLDLETLSWSILVLVENGFEKKAQSGKQADYYALAKVICRMVFPPQALETLRNCENSTAGEELEH
ncbi:TetR/AcrR family transcriptional regulator [Neobacillus muris]|uniref:TetR/AcrR family transcriptional regulator n=1 Tax=Neobacillus muris TaxID=2941334 RepID=UPI0020411F6C|nr:TetR/AcrR family transcriptional regulator [Neobacillus muris]